MLNRFKDGDELAFEQLYKRHSVALLKIAYRKTAILEVAEELVQDTFFSFYNRRDDVGDNALLYLKAILKFKVLDYVKTKKQVYFFDIDVIKYFSDEASLNHTIDAKETYAIVYNHVQQLPEQCRRVFTLSREANLSNKEIAEKLGISVKAVEANITRALRYLKEKVNYRWLWLVILGGGVS